VIKPETPTANILPVLKWVGGKRRLIAKVMEGRPEISGRYIEPFLGGAAVLLSIGPGIPKFGNDLNEDLITTYISIRDKLDEVLAKLASLGTSKEDYYKIRELDRLDSWKEIDDITKTARFLYLNKLSFNGIYRVNSAGYFNVPYGGEPQRKFDFDALRDFSRFLNIRTADSELETQFCHGDFFDFTLDKNPTRGDFVYLDPPYSASLGTSSFVSYQRGGFGPEQQEKVFVLARQIHENGGHFAISNADTEEIERLIMRFKGKALPLVTRRVEVQRNVSGLASGRSSVPEVVITNY
jgi:DNA adenine methylase